MALRIKRHAPASLLVRSGVGRGEIRIRLGPDAQNGLFPMLV